MGHQFILCTLRVVKQGLKEKDGAEGEKAVMIWDRAATIYSLIYGSPGRRRRLRSCPQGFSHPNQAVSDSSTPTTALGHQARPRS